MRALLAHLLALAPLAALACARPVPWNPVAPAAKAAELGRTYRWSFDTAAEPGGDPLAVGRSRVFLDLLGGWRAQPDADAVSAPNVYRPTRRYRTPADARVIVSGLAFADVRARVRCRLDDDAHDPGAGDCGLVLRAVDGDGYLLARARRRDGVIELVRVQAGVARSIASAPVPITTGAWHELAVQAIGASVRVRWDGAEAVAGLDDVHTTGAVGLWTAGDGVAAFDDFEATAI